MSITLGDTVTDTCQAIKAGTILRLFDLHFTTTLMPISPPPSPVLHTLTKVTDKALYISLEQDRQLYVCDKTNFDKKWWLRRMMVKLLPRCPWFEHDAAIYKVTDIYNEATNPFNGIDSPLLEVNQPWPVNTPVDDHNYTTEAINAPWGPAYGSDGISEIEIKVEQIDPDPSNRGGPITIKVTATLIRFGRAYDFLTTPSETVQFVSCENWNLGAAVGGAFIGVAFPIGPVGIVMSIGWTITGGQGFIG